MALFPAYGPPGSRRAQEGSSKSEAPLFSIDRGGDQRGGQGRKEDSRPEIIVLDSVGSSDGEIVDDDANEGHEEQQQQPGPSSSSKRKKAKKKSVKRKRSSSRSRSGRRRRSSSEERGGSHKKKDKRSRRDSRERYNDYEEEEHGRGRGNNRDRERGHQQNYNQNSRGREERNRGGDRRDYYDDGKNQRGQHDYHEEQRLRVAQNFPRKVFLEEVNLKPEYAFRMDSEGNKKNLLSYSLSNFQKSYYEYGGKIFGATDKEVDSIYSKFSKFRCKLPDALEHEEDRSSSDDEPKSKKKSSSRKNSCGVKNTETFISFGKGRKEDSGKLYPFRVDVNEGFETLSIPRKEGELSMKEKIERYNSELRDQPTNVKLWKEFVTFQDQVFEQSDQLYEYTGGNEAPGGKKGSKKKRNRKALVDKKVSILEKALIKNPKVLDLHLLRLELLYEVNKPSMVLNEWKKLVSNNQQLSSFWMEYLRFASTQLQVYSSSSVASLFQKCFQKFQQMSNPTYPAFQRPVKFALVIADLLFSLCLLMKSAGYKEKSVALHQAQLEIDFYNPSKNDPQADWTDDSALFEVFWDIGTARFGEPGAPGWSTVVETKVADTADIGLSDSKISIFEDNFFESISSGGEGSSESRKTHQEHWLSVESIRSKLHRLPWRANCSDLEEIEDYQRVVSSSDVRNYVSPVPVVSYISSFDRQAAYFRHVINLILTLQEDFLPHTQTLDTILSPFTLITLSESKSLFSDIFYWKKLLSLYSGEELKDQKLKTPEGFTALDLTSSGPINGGVHIESTPKIVLPVYSSEVEATKNELLTLNYNHHLSMLRNIVEKSIDLLEPPFSALLFEMYVRYEQKTTFASLENRKARAKIAKNLMKKDKLRNSMGAFREISMLEFFEGRPATAVELLTKTINLGCSTLTENFDLNEEWDKITDLVQMYRQLAEFHLKTNQPLAFHILTLMGNGFKPVNLKRPESELAQLKTNLLLKALRQFEKILAQLIPGIELEDIDEESPQLKASLENWNGDKSVEFMLQKPNLIVEWTKAFALFQYLAKDFETACDIYGKVLKRVVVSEPLNSSCQYDSNLANRHNIREQLYISWCNLGALVLAKNPMTNAKFRNILGKALEEYPSSPPLLLLFTDVENQMSIAGKLWRMMVALVKQDGGCNHWTPLLMGYGLAKKIEDLERDEEVGLDCFGIGGPAVPPDTIFYKLDSLLSAAQSNRITRNCPLVWRVHLKLLALRAQVGKDVRRAKITFYDGIRHCPSSKALYMDGVTYFPEILKEITELMAEKKIYVRLPIEELEVLLEIELGKEAKEKNTGSESDAVVISDSDEDV